MPELSRPHPRIRFATTRWSRILNSGPATSEATRESLEILMRDYWRPIYAYLRSSGLQPADAEDATQGFLSRMIESENWRAADPSRGRFRSFLLASLKHWLANERRAQTSQRRGGSTQLYSLDFASAESTWQSSPLDHESPERIFERRWALLLMENALNRVRASYERTGKLPLFDHLKACLGSSDSGLAAAAQILGLSEAAVRVAVHRLRKRCRDALRVEVARTLESIQDLDQEVQTVIGWLNHS